MVVFAVTRKKTPWSICKFDFLLQAIHQKNAVTKEHCNGKHSGFIEGDYIRKNTRLFLCNTKVCIKLVLIVFGSAIPNFPGNFNLLSVNDIFAEN